MKIASDSDSVYYKTKKDYEIILTSIIFLNERYTFVTMKDTEEIYYYDSDRGIYVKNGEIFIKKELGAMHAYISSQKVREIINTIKSKTYTDRTEFDSKIEWRACKDCMINLLNGEIRPLSPEFMATIQIPISYKKFLDLPDYQFSCPKIMKFLNEVVSDKRDIETILDFMAYCLWPEMKFHKSLILEGDGRNGKSTLCNLFTRFLGIENVANESFAQLVNRPFSSSQLNRKLVNIDSDISEKIFRNTGILKN